MEVPVYVVVIVAVVVVLFIIFAVYWSVKAHQKRVAAGREDLMGKTAIVEMPLEPRGIVLVEGERWTATIDQGRVEPEEEVIVTGIQGLKLTVSRKQ